MQGRTQGDLTFDAMFRRALKDCIQEIGEAASKVTDAGRQRAASLPWPKMVGMRHILVHAYFDLDLDAIWKVASQELDPLISSLESALAAWNQTD